MGAKGLSGIILVEGQDMSQSECYRDWARVTEREITMLFGPVWVLPVTKTISNPLECTMIHRQQRMSLMNP